MKAQLARLLTHAADALLELRNALLPAEAVLMELSTGPIASRCLYVAAELGIADRIADGPSSVEDLAAATGAHPGALARVLRVLAGMGVVREDGRGRFRLGRLGAPLRTGGARSLAPWVRYAGADWAWSAWAPFIDAVRTGKTVHELAHDKAFFELYAERPERQQLFDAAMASVTGCVADAIAAACPLPPAATIVDVGGGRGALLAAILRAHPAARGVLFDRSVVIDGARRDGPLATGGLAARATFAAGDLWSDAPPPGDQLLKWILHDWSDEQALAILRRCRTTARRLLVVEMLVEPDGRPGPAKTMDIAMLALTGGRERTRDEYASLLAASGFRLSRAIPTASPFTILEALPVG